MHLLMSGAAAIHGMSGMVVIALSMLALGAFTFTNSYFDNDIEEWTFTSLIGDTTGSLTFKNADYRLAPRVWISPTDASFHADSMYLSAPSATAVTANQTGGVGAGAGRIFVERRR